MKKTLIGLSAMLLLAGMVGTASANSVTFNFNDSTNHVGVQSGLVTYMETTSGLSNIATSGIDWYGESTLFGSDALYASASNGSGTIDFDTTSSSSSNFKIENVQFTWGVYDATSGIDFGLDVYSDSDNTWHNNVFTIYSSDYTTGNSGLVTFNSSWQVTQLRIHDDGTYDVGIDNLTINDNRCATTPTPEPATMLLLGTGLAGLAGARRRKKA